MMIADQKLQIGLTACLIALAVIALFFSEAPSGAILQIGASLIAITGSFIAVFVARRTHAAKTDAESRDNKAALDEARAPLREDELLTHLETKSLFVSGGSSLAKALYRHEVEAVPVYRQGNQFICDTELEDKYSISIGIVNVEVEEGEAIITIKRPNQPYAPPSEIHKNFLRAH